MGWSWWQKQMKKKWFLCLTVFKDMDGSITAGEAQDTWDHRLTDSNCWNMLFRVHLLTRPWKVHVCCWGVGVGKICYSAPVKDALEKRTLETMDYSITFPVLTVLLNNFHYCSFHSLLIPIFQCLLFYPQQACIYNFCYQRISQYTFYP